MNGFLVISLNLILFISSFGLIINLCNLLSRDRNTNELIKISLFFLLVFTFALLIKVHLLNS